MKYETLMRQVIKQDSVPKGFKTAAEWGRVWKKGGTATKLALALAREHKLVEVREFRILRGASGVAPVNHYRFKRKAI